MIDIYKIILHPLLWSLILTITGILVLIKAITGKGKKVLQFFILFWLLLPFAAIIAPLTTGSRIYFVAKDTILPVQQSFSQIYISIISNITYDFTLLTPWENHQQIIILNFFSTNQVLIQNKISTKAETTAIFGVAHLPDDNNIFLLGKKAYRTSRFSPTGNFLQIDSYTFGGTTKVFAK